MKCLGRIWTGGRCILEDGKCLTGSPQRIELRVAVSVALVTAGPLFRVRSRRTFTLAALGAAQPFYYRGEFGIPSRKRGQGFGVTPAGVATLAGEQDFVLPEMVVQFVNFEVAHTDTVHPSSYAIKSVKHRAASGFSDVGQPSDGEGQGL